MTDRTDRPVDPAADAPADLPLRKKLLFAAVVLALFLAALEGVLALAGVRPVLRDDDPFLGFAATVPLFVQETAADGTAVWRTAPNKRLFNRQEFPVAKAPGTVRVFCVGGSTTFGRPYDDTTSFAAWLRELLPQAAPGTRFEVINAGGVSYASYRVARLMQELARYDPDLFVVYSGQNEFLEERTYRTLKRVPAPVRAVSAVLARTRTWAAMGLLLDRAGLRGGSDPAPGTQLAEEADTLLEHFGPEVYVRDDALRARILEHYRISLERMARIARDAGAEVVYVTPASNLKDCSPFRSQHTDGLAPADAAAVAAALQAARAQLQADDPAAALALLDRALASDPRHAELHYRRGRALLALGRTDEAAAAFDRALEEDVCPLRALPAMQTAVADVARHAGARHVDFARLVAADARAVVGYPIPGDEHFLDHVHPTIAANGLLAAALVEPVLAGADLGPARPVTGEMIAATGARLEARLEPARRARSLANLARVTAWSGKLEGAVAPARQALAFEAADAMTVASAASILATWHALQGEDAEADRLYGLALAATPGDHDLHFRLALRELDRPRPDRALAAAHLVYAAVYWQGARRDAPHRTLAGLLAADGQHRAALAHLLEARAIDPANPETAALLARVAGTLGPAAGGVAPPKFTVDAFPSGRIRRIVQVVVDPAGNAAPDGAWTEWHENGRPARWAEVGPAARGTAVTGTDAAWDPDGRRLPGPAGR